MADLAASTRVVVSTVGPYALYGSPLVAAVAAAGTDYCDLTGEPQWMRAMIDAHHETAVASGRPDRARLRLRLDPERPGRLVHAAAGHRTVRRTVHLDRVAGQGDEGRRQRRNGRSR